MLRIFSYVLPTVSGQNHWKDKPFTSSQRVDICNIYLPGGALGQVSYGGVQLRDPNPYPILGKAGLRKHTLL